MPHDHYVPQVHLKNWYATSLNGRKMYGYRRNGTDPFPCGSEDVCRIKDGSTNPFMDPDRALEDFLKRIEPRYKPAIAAIQSTDFDGEAIFAVAGYMAYIAACSPTAVRLGSHLLRSTIEETARLLDKDGKLPKPPEGMGADTLTELLEGGLVGVSVDAKYPHAMGMNSVHRHIATFGNSHWVLINNHFSDSPFFSSDFPIAYINSPTDARIVNKFFPLTPNFGVLVLPDIAAADMRLEDGFSRLRFRRVNASRKEVIDLNRLIVQCAERYVFASHNSPWVQPFVRKNADFKLVPTFEKVRVDGGNLMLFGQRVERVGASD